MQSIQKNITRIAIAVSLSVCLLACTENIAYRHKVLPYSSSDLAECNDFGGSLEYIKQENSDYYLGFVEVDDQGMFFNRDQFKNLTCELSSHAKSSGILISIFVHGWHHNANFGDENIEKFQESLTTLSQFEHLFAQEKGVEPRKTVGIYVGWRGESLDLGFLSNLSFWDRKSNAEEIAQRSILEALLRLEKIRNIKPSYHQANRLFIVGHSFGADVVYNALAPIMLERLLRDNKMECDNGTIRGFGDFVFLINPAFESLQYINFSSLLAEKNIYCYDQFPVFAALTSEQDKATKYAFPFGRKLSALFETYRDIELKGKGGEKIIVDQRQMDTTAIGHEQLLFTHELENNKAVDSSTSGLTDDECNIVRDFRKGWMSGEKENFLNDVLLKNTHQYDPKNPYLIIKVDSEIIPDHNDIYANQVINFMRRLVVISTHEEVCSDP